MSFLQYSGGVRCRLLAGAEVKGGIGDGEAVSAVLVGGGISGV